MKSTPVSCSEDMFQISSHRILLLLHQSQRQYLGWYLYSQSLARLASVITCNLTDDIAIYTYMNQGVFVMLGGLQTYTEHVSTHRDFGGHASLSLHSGCTHLTTHLVYYSSF